jgi:ethanolamine ammonia-lyase small subunit
MANAEPDRMQTPPASFPGDASALLKAIRAQTPARILVGRAGPSYRTATQLELRHDHAFAVDAVYAELDLKRDFGPELVEYWQLFEVSTCAGSKAEYLVRPDLGRRLSEVAGEQIIRQCPVGSDFQVVIGDGLSAAAVAAQVPPLLPLLQEQARQRSWRFGRPLVVRYCRVGVLNDIGELLDPAIVVLLIGERPGLATAESLSAYLAYRPRSGQSDSQRNLISNIHARGVPPEAAAQRIAALAAKMRQMQSSGVTVKENLASDGETGTLISANPPTEV